MKDLLSKLKENFVLGYKIINLVYKTAPGWTTILLGTSVLNSITPTITLYFGKLSIDALIYSLTNPGVSAYGKILTLAIIVLCFRIINSVFDALYNFAYDHLKDLFVLSSSEKFYKKAAELDLKYFDDSKFHDELEKIRTGLLYRPIQAVDQVVSFGSSLLATFSLSFVLFKLNFFAPFILLLFSLPRLIFRMKYKYYTYSISDNRSPFNRKVWQINYWLSNNDAAKEVKAFQLKDYLLKIFRDINNKFIDENKSLAKKQTIFSFILDTLGISTYFSFSTFTIIQTLNKVLTVGDLTMITSAINQFQSTLQGTFASLSNFYESNLFLKHYFDFMELKPTINNIDHPLKLDLNSPLEIEFKNVTFEYEPNKPIIKGVNFKIEKGQNIALVGINGAGKTTIVKLILRLYEVTGGEIFINGQNIKNYEIENLRENIGIIFQDFGQYEISVRENIGFGNVKKIDDIEGIKKAAKLSGASDFIEKFDNKYETTLGKYWEKGEELSGGQWQKIALARAFFRDSKVLIMDEPTSALDPKSEYEVFKNLIGHTKNKSLILISHRFSTVRLADKIIVLENGKIIEEGSHEKLMKNKGQYSKLYNLQAKWYK